jgi:RNA polymerase sigma-70 factor (ECF subfamily)
MAIEDVVRSHWWRAVATVTRLVGDLELAEDAVQDACLAALDQWPARGVPANPGSWLIGTAHHKALDAVRREARRGAKEDAAMRTVPTGRPHDRRTPIADDELALIFACCHPALDPGVRVPLTLRAVCGLDTAAIAAVFLMPEPRMAQRLVRAKRKIRAAAIPFRVPPPEDLPGRLDDVLQVVYLMFTEGHHSARGPAPVRDDLCDAAIQLARALACLLPDQCETSGLLALLLLTDARRPARRDSTGAIVLLGDQDRSRWDQTKIREGVALIEATLPRHRPGAYQIQAAIAACHAAAADLESTDWRQIAELYHRLWDYQPTGVVAAHRAVAVAMADGPDAGLVILDDLAKDVQLAGWAPLQVARAELLHRAGQHKPAAEALRRAIALGLPVAELDLIQSRIEQFSPSTEIPDG